MIYIIHAPAFRRILCVHEYIGTQHSAINTTTNLILIQCYKIDDDTRACGKWRRDNIHGSRTSRFSYMRTTILMIYVCSLVAVNKHICLVSAGILLFPLLYFFFFTHNHRCVPVSCLGNNVTSQMGMWVRMLRPTFGVGCHQCVPVQFVIIERILCTLNSTR